MTPQFGLGLYRQHYEEIISTLPKQVEWFEIISENFIAQGGTALHYLDKIRSHYPIAMHGTSLSIGSAEPLDKQYLKNLKALVDRIEPIWISDHFCFSNLKGIYSHDLLPISFTSFNVSYMVDRIMAVQDYLGRKILLENVSSYILFEENEMTEWEFISEVAKKADCDLLLDINNIFVNAHNHQFSAEEFLNNIPFDKVKEFHIAGHHKTADVIIDTHGEPISTEVYDLYAKTLLYAKNVPIIIERDNNTPAWPVLLDELEKVKKMANTNA